MNRAQNTNKVWIAKIGENTPVNIFTDQDAAWLETNDNVHWLALKASISLPVAPVDFCTAETMLSNELLNASVSVSYTHLDVYKRQSVLHPVGLEELTSKSGGTKVEPFLA